MTQIPSKLWPMQFFWPFKVDIYNLYKRSISFNAVHMIYNLILIFSLFIKTYPFLIFLFFLNKFGVSLMEKNRLQIKRKKYNRKRKDNNTYKVPTLIIKNIRFAHFANF